MPAKFLIIAAKFNDLITKALLAGAHEVFAEAGVGSDDVDTLWVPGAFELPVVAAKAAASKRYAAIITLGAVIRGDTPHFEFVAGECARGLMDTSRETGIPVIFGVLTTDTVEQALGRCGIKSGNKGADAARAALSMAKVMDQLSQLTGPRKA